MRITLAHTQSLLKKTHRKLHILVCSNYLRERIYILHNTIDNQGVDLQEETFAGISSRITCSTKFYHMGIKVCQCEVQKTKNSNDYKLYMTNVP